MTVNLMGEGRAKAKNPPGALAAVLIDGALSGFHCTVGWRIFLGRRRYCTAAAAAHDRCSPAAHLLMLLIKKLRLQHAARP